MQQHLAVHCALPIDFVVDGREDRWIATHELMMLNGLIIGTL